MLTAGKRFFYLVIGLVATALGALGIFVPGLPTVPFILVALWAFSNSSQRAHQWINQWTIFRQAHKQIEVYQNERSIELKTKVVAQVAAWLSCILVTISFRNIALSIATGLAATACSVFMLTTPTRSTQREANTDPS